MGSAPVIIAAIFANVGGWTINKGDNLGILKTSITQQYTLSLFHNFCDARSISQARNELLNNTQRKCNIIGLRLLSKLTAYCLAGGWFNKVQIEEERK